MTRETATTNCYDAIRVPPTAVEIAELVNQCSLVPKLGDIARRLAYHYESRTHLKKIEDDAKYIYRALDYIRQSSDSLADALQSTVEQKRIEELQAIGGSANAAMARAMSIGDECRSSS
ncbi:MAG: hypothetical protein E6Q97_30705 [Desulfurellales bacterium]|nr:MAG: hypothetical protein E6Q97_30705 [Desulfurellales bacterium]